MHHHGRSMAKGRNIRCSTHERPLSWLFRYDFAALLSGGYRPLTDRGAGWSLHRAQLTTFQNFLQVPRCTAIRPPSNHFGHLKLDGLLQVFTGSFGCGCLRTDHFLPCKDWFWALEAVSAPNNLCSKHLLTFLLLLSVPLQFFYHTIVAVSCSIFLQALTSRRCRSRNAAATFRFSASYETKVLVFPFPLLEVLSFLPFARK
jgi:hypothetical protein